MQLAWLTDTATRDVSQAVHYTLLWGLEAVELRTVGGASDRVPDVDERTLRTQLREHDLPVAAITPGLFQGRASDRSIWMNDLLLLDEVLRFCDRFQCGRVVVSAFSETPSLDKAAEPLRRAAEKAEAWNVTLCVLNEPGMAHATGQALSALLEAVGHPSMQAVWRPASALGAGETPGEGLAALGAAPAMVRVSDGVRREGHWDEKPVGQGGVGWEQHLRELDAQGFGGPLSLEVNTTPASQQGVRAAGRLVRWRRSLGASSASSDPQVASTPDDVE